MNNLVSNALKFGQGRSIRLIVKASAAGASITVRDQGAGISPADRLRIFERNIHAPTEQGGGHGIGLWLVRELAVAHGGRVTVHSRRGRGTTFTVFLRTLPPMVGGLGPVAVSRVPPQRSPSPVRTVTYAAGSRSEAAADYWHDRVARSQTKTALPPRREAAPRRPCGAAVHRVGSVRIDDRLFSQFRADLHPVFPAGQALASFCAGELRRRNTIRFSPQN